MTKKRKRGPRKLCASKCRRRKGLNCFLYEGHELEVHMSFKAGKTLTWKGQWDYPKELLYSY
jgi:hypothetical protein